MESLVDALLSDRDDVEFDVSSLRQALLDPDRGPLIAAALIESPDLRRRATETLRQLPDPSSEAASRWVAVASLLEDQSVDEQIDAWIGAADSAPAAIDGLLRAGVDWYHPALADYLDHTATAAAFGAAWLLVRADADEFEVAIADLEETGPVVAALRATSLAAERDWFDSLLEWRHHLVDDADQRDRDRLDAALACLAPDKYARAVLTADLGDHWLGDDRPVADFVTRQGPTTWTAALALFREVRDREAFELCASFATCAATSDAFDDVDEDDLDPGDAARWLREEPARVAFALAISDEDELAQLLVEATLHEALLRRDLQPPSITGLPLSGPAPDPVDLDDRLSIFDDLDIDDPRHRVALVRTLGDLVALVHRDAIDEQSARPFLERFADANDAAGRLLRAFDAGEPVGRTGDWGCRGIDAMTWQLHRPAERGLPRIADGWFSGPVERASLYRASFRALRR